MYYKYHILYIFLFFSISAYAQVATDITPNKEKGTTYNNLKADKKGNLFVIKSNSNSRILKRYTDGSWTDITQNFSGDPDKLFLSGDKVYGIGYSSSMYFKLNYWQGNRWDSIPLTPIGGHIRSIAQLPNGQLVVKGKFSSNKGNYYLATLKDSIWMPYDTYVEDNAIRYILEKYQYLNILTDKKGNIYMYCWAVGSDPNDHVVLSFDGKKWTKIWSDAQAYVSTMTVSENGTVYIGGFFKKGNEPSSFVKWTGSEWKNIACVSGNYDCNWMPIITLDDADEPIVAGNNKGSNGYAILSYVNEKGEQYASISNGPIVSMAYGKGRLYAVADQNKSIWMVPKGNKGPAPVAVAPKQDIKAKEVYDITTDFLNVINSLMKDYIKTYKQMENSANNTEARPYAKSIANRTAYLKSIIGVYDIKFRNLGLSKGSNELADIMMPYCGKLYSLVYALDDIATHIAYVRKEKPDPDKLEANKNKRFNEVEESNGQIENLLPVYKKRNGIL
jgi:hypothetical protein